MNSDHGHVKTKLKLNSAVIIQSHLRVEWKPNRAVELLTCAVSSGKERFGFGILQDFCLVPEKR